MPTFLVRVIYTCTCLWNARSEKSNVFYHWDFYMYEFKYSQTKFLLKIHIILQEITYFPRICSSLAILRSLINFAFSSLFKTISTISKYCYSERRQPNENMNITMKKNSLNKKRNENKYKLSTRTKYCQYIMGLTCISWNHPINFSLSLSKHLFLDLNKN